MTDDPGGVVRPTLRQLDVRREDRNGQSGVVLTDPLGISEQQIFVPDGLLPIVSRFDGTRTIAEIAAELTTEAGRPLPENLVGDLCRQLDEILYLEGERFSRALGHAMQEFAGGGTRPSAHAGVSAGYPGEPSEVREALESMVRRPPADTALRPPPRGLVAPHIDLFRGREAYSMSYSALAECEPADLYVVFGTGHQGPRSPVTGLALDWDTPIGAMPTDRDFVAAIHEKVGPAAPSDLFLHRNEHSLEFQMLFLRHVVGDHDAKVAGFLTGHLPSSTAQVIEEPYVQDLLGAFRDACRDRERAGQRVCFVAGADLAHIGPEFGDAEAVDESRLDRLTEEEHEKLAFLERGDPSGFHAAVLGPGNPDRICGTTPMFLTAALADCPGRLLHYGQANADAGRLTVSYCGMLFEPAEETSNQ